jgi:hypothetical protein
LADLGPGLFEHTQEINHQKIKSHLMDSQKGARNKSRTKISLENYIVKIMCFYYPDLPRTESAPKNAGYIQPSLRSVCW